VVKPYAGTRSDFRAVLALAQAGRIGVRTQRFALEEAAHALDELEHGRVHGRAVLVP
jgi:propanol-preferring alcohol dehydrogenase